MSHCIFALKLLKWSLQKSMLQFLPNEKGYHPVIRNEWKCALGFAKAESEIIQRCMQIEIWKRSKNFLSSMLAIEYENLTRITNWYIHYVTFSRKLSDKPHSWGHFQARQQQHSIPCSPTQIEPSLYGQARNNKSRLLIPEIIWHNRSDRIFLSWSFSIADFRQNKINLDI